MEKTPLRPTAVCVPGLYFVLRTWLRLSFSQYQLDVNRLDGLMDHESGISQFNFGTGKTSFQRTNTNPMSLNGWPFLPKSFSLTILLAILVLDVPLLHVVIEPGIQ